MQAIREGDFVGVRYGVKSHSDPFEIYNVVIDPKETRNLAAEHPALQQRLHDAVLRLRRPNASAPRPYDGELVPALPPANLAAGVKWRTFASSAPWLARFDDLTPTAAGTLAEIAVPPGNDAAGLLFSGFFEAPVDGEFTFTLPAGDTALLRVHEATVIDTAFAPMATETSGAILLRAGRHPFRLYWQPSATAPRLEVTGPSLTRQAIPSTMLYRE
jgi:hypothetical protein